ncbi:hypothetical protein AAEH84_19430 [Shewanella indica]|uniref:hypothetical protein n=1 Tax=Shewanella indica TaxID=768528 RepID=UPI00313D0F3C
MYETAEKIAHNKVSNTKELTFPFVTFDFNLSIRINNIIGGTKQDELKIRSSPKPNAKTANGLFIENLLEE